jgi:hypothetical protein
LTNSPSFFLFCLSAFFEKFTLGIALSFVQKLKKKGGIVDPMLSIWGQQLIVNEDANQ